MLDNLITKSDKEALQRVPAYGGFVRIEFVLSFFSAFDVLSKTSPDGFIIRKIPIDNHQLPLKIRQLPVASSRFFRFSIFFFLILAFSDLFYYLLILYTKHKFLFCLDPMLPLFSLLYRNHPGSDVSHHPAYRR